MFKLINLFRRSCLGATSVEYALLAMCIAMVIIVAVGFLGTQINTSYTHVTSAFN
jgi:Flp pilus assembly pilin Flp